MKNSTLLHLFFISIGLPLTCASSSSASTSSSATTLKPKRRPAPLLVDTTNNVEPVQPKEHGIMVRDFSWRYPFIRTKWQGPEHFQELLKAKKYRAIIKIGEGMKDDEFLKCLCPVVTTLDHFKGLYEYLKQRKMVPDFLAHGEMALVRKVIVETDLLKTEISAGVTVSTMQLPCHSRKTAMNVLQVFLKLHMKDPPGRASSTGL